MKSVDEQDKLFVAVLSETPTHTSAGYDNLSPFSKLAYPCIRSLATSTLEIAEFKKKDALDSSCSISQLAEI